MDDERLARVLELLPCTAGRPRTVTPLVGGLTNVNLKVVTDERAVVLRLSSLGEDLLAIDRDAEHENSRRAAASGAAPAVVDYLADERVLVVAYVDGRTCTPADLAIEANLVRVAATCRALHGGPRFVGDFDMFAVQRRYLSIVQERGFRIPAGYLDFDPSLDRVAGALSVRAEPSVPCNNDLLAANFIDDGCRVWIIDYEYGGNNDACFELGNIWSESDLSLDHLELLVDSYYGRHLRHKVARARLFGLLSKYGWTLWASIRAETSSMDFDFWSWGMDKYERAVQELDGPAFPRLLAEATRPD